VRLLLDTHVLLWALQDSPLLGSEARELLHHAEAAYVSAASVWESHIKADLGRLTLPEGFIAAIGQSGFRELPVGWEHTAAIDRIKLPHRDPFDRLLMAQAEFCLQSMKFCWLPTQHCVLTRDANWPVNWGLIPYY